MGDDDILISDVGAHKIWVARNYPAYTPGSVIISNGFCSMGIALPGAISAKRLFPDRRVVGLAGDAGFLMNIQEMATAVQYKIPATFLVWEDSSFGLIKWKQESTFGRTSHVDFKNPDFVKLAESFGARGIRVDATASLIPAMEEAFANDKSPTVVVVPVDYSENLKLTNRLGDLTGSNH
jgi:acetolactate synthase-1/2/3 large subunit